MSQTRPGWRGSQWAALSHAKSWTGSVTEFATEIRSTTKDYEQDSSQSSLPRSSWHPLPSLRAEVSTSSPQTPASLWGARQRLAQEPNPPETVVGGAAGDRFETPGGTEVGRSPGRRHSILKYPGPGYSAQRAAVSVDCHSSIWCARCASRRGGAGSPNPLKSCARREAAADDLQREGLPV